MSRRRLRIEVEERVIIVRGWRAGDLARDAGLKPLWSPVTSGWTLDRRRLPDLLAFLETRNVPVEVDDPAQGALFGGGAA